MKRASFTTGIEKLSELFASCQQKPRQQHKEKKKTKSATWCGHQLTDLNKEEKKKENIAKVSECLTKHVG